MNDQKPLRVLQVGLGGWGRDWAWRVVPDINEVDLVGYVDSDPAALDLVAKEVKPPPGRCFESLKEAIAATQPEAALITATLPGHAPVAKAALDAGLHVLVEKPFAPNLPVAHELVQLADAKERVLMVSQNYRFFPAARAVAKFVHQSSLGMLHEISIDFRRWSSSGPKGKGRHHYDEQPLLVDMSIHHFDLLRYILGREPERIYCEAWNPEWSAFSGPSAAVASIAFDGVTVSYRGSWVSAGPVTPWAGEWRMEFEGGEVSWSSRDDNDAALHDLVVITPRGGKAKSVSLPRMSRIDRWGTLAEFASAVRGGRQPECSGRDNLGTMAFVFAAVESATRRELVAPSALTAKLVI